MATIGYLHQTVIFIGGALAAGTASGASDQRHRHSGSTRPPASASCASPQDLSIIGFDDLPVARWAFSLKILLY
jgi:hypothetical protein